jgi:hypothetical protein
MRIAGERASFWSARLGLFMPADDRKIADVAANQAKKETGNKGPRARNYVVADGSSRLQLVANDIVAQPGPYAS